MLFSLSDARKLAVWDTETGRVRSWPHLGRDGTRDGAISSEVRWLALGQGERKMFLWSLEKGEPEKRLELATPDNPTRVALSRALPSGFPRLAYGQWVGNIEVLDLDAKGPTVVRQLKLSKTPTAVALSGDGQLLATCSCRMACSSGRFPPVRNTISGPARLPVLSACGSLLMASTWPPA